MGIRPYSSGQVPVRAAPDSAETRFKPWVDDLEDAGSKTGEVWGDIDAKASSSNESLTKLSGDLTAAEKRITALESSPGPDLSGYATKTDLATKQGVLTVRQETLPGLPAVVIRRWGNVVTLTATAAVDKSALLAATLPDWARPVQVEGCASIGSTTGSAVYARGNGAFTVTGTDTTVQFTMTYIVD